ncbi:MAG: MBL fold metallo-hydrolase, partial [Candidatus Micrarchaeota archaeon]
KAEILAIDSGAYPVLETEPSMLVLTHAHYDHTSGVAGDWKNVYLHKDDFLDGPFFKIPKQAKPIDFEKIKWGDFELEVLRTPGHTLGSICLFERKKKILISGDTLFADGIGRTDLGGDEKMMAKSLALLEKLEWKTLCPGHGELARR